MEKIKLIYPEAHIVEEALGITDARIVELFEHILEVREIDSRPAQIAENISYICTHPNELAACCFMLGRLYSLQDSGMGSAAWREFRKEVIKLKSSL